MTAAPRATTKYEVGADGAGERLDSWLAGRPAAGTRSQIARAIADGLVLVNDRPAKAGQRLRAGEIVNVQTRTDSRTSGIVPEPIELDILHSDDDVIAVNKAAGMVVHPAVGNRSGTLVHALLHLYPRASWPGDDERAGIVHRLDRDTSGVILVARTVAAHEALAKQFRERTIEKEYLALVHGRVARAGAVDAAIGRHPTDRKRMSVAARRARAAVTTYEPIESFPTATLLLVRPHTGRTHQIRVHLAASGWPIVADPLYGRGRGKSGRRAAGDAEGPTDLMPRLALHALRIGFDHPRTGKRMVVSAPRPPDLEATLRVLRRERSG